MVMETQWLTANEAAQYLKVKPRTVLVGPSKAASPDTRCPAHGASRGDS